MKNREATCTGKESDDDNSEIMDMNDEVGDWSKAVEAADHVKPTDIGGGEVKQTDLSGTETSGKNIPTSSSCVSSQELKI